MAAARASAESLDIPLYRYLGGAGANTLHDEVTSLGGVAALAPGGSCGNTGQHALQGRDLTEIGV